VGAPAISSFRITETIAPTVRSSFSAGSTTLIREPVARFAASSDAMGRSEHE
jgi:hypothetical protein